VNSFIPFDHGRLHYINLEQMLQKNFRGSVLCFASNRGDVNIVLHEHHSNYFHQMPEFSLKMHQIQFRHGLRPRPHWGTHSAPPNPLTGFGEKGRIRRNGAEERGRVSGKGKGLREGRKGIGKGGMRTG